MLRPVGLAAGTRIGRFEVVGLIGAGGMGEVYRAHDSRLGRDVAIKVLPTELRTSEARLVRFEQEARAAGTLNHPNVVALFDVGSYEDAPFVVTELLEGASLRKHIQGGPIPVRRALEWAVQIAQGLAAAHEKGITHRDLKPENIFVTKTGIVKILDFGLAKLTQPEQAAQGSSPTIPNLTDPEAAVGTPAYMSPEQVRAQPVDHRSDLFSLGVVLYEMLSGRHAFQGTTAADVMGAILRDEPAELTGIPQAIERIVRRCLEKSALQRFQAARDVAFALEAVSTQSGTAVASLGPLPAARSPARRTLMLAAIVAAGAATAGFVIGRGRSTPRTPPTASTDEPPRYQHMTFRRGTVDTARFGPDGRTIIYQAAWDGAPAELFVARTDSPDAKPLGIRDAEVLAISPSGEMALKLHPHYEGEQSVGTLARAPMLGGTPREILQDVQYADFAPDGELAIVRQVGNKTRLEYPIGRVQWETVGWLSHPKFSPDGKQIALLEHPVLTDDRGYLVVMPVGGNPRRLGGERTAANGIGWSPGGREIWFSGNDPSSIESWVHGISPSDGRERVLARGPTNLYLKDVAPDSRVLVVDRAFESEIRYVSATGERSQNLSWHEFEVCSDLAADGQQFLFTEAGTGMGGPNYGVFLRKTDGSPAVRLGDGAATQISPDGKWAVAVQFSPPPEHLVLLPTGPGEPRRLSFGDRAVLDGGLLRDGKRIAFEARDRDAGVRAYVADLQGGAPRPILDTLDGVEGGALGSDRVAYRKNESIVVQPLDGTPPRALAVALGSVPIRFSQDERRLFLFRRGPPARIEQLELASGKVVPYRDVVPTDPSGLKVIRVWLSEDARSYLMCAYHRLDRLHVVTNLPGN